ncbi:hypothetical protein [Paenibacillus alginolyticus]|nr:hypothetical protein [Paenibacillus alginolyticus]MEC0148285.1 hypothetical protein [Paenibacillus alginolyticus]
MKAIAFTQIARMKAPLNKQNLTVVRAWDQACFPSAFDSAES